MTQRLVRTLLAPTLGVLLALPLAPAWAQYKVVGPDGSVTYTDRPPANTTGRVTALGRNAVAAATGTEPALPAELRQAVQKFPVTLYTVAECTPCDNGRRYLQQRGVPYSEKRISSEEDTAALERLVGGRTVPSLTVGAQALRGMSEADWASYLDAAGYPRENKLPRNWQPPAATPLVERAAPVRQAAAPAPAPVQAEPEERSPSGVRF